MSTLRPSFVARRSLLQQGLAALALSGGLIGLPQPGWAQSPLLAPEVVQALVAKEQAAFVQTLKSLVEIESGSSDREGLERIAALVAERLRAAGGQVELIEPSEAEIYKMFDTPERIGPMVKATFKGKGSRKILLIAHMDTVYPRGMLAQQPFRVEGSKAYGLGIADDKQGVAMLLHVVGLLKQLGVHQDWGQLTVLINSDEEISSPGSRATLTREGRAHDVVLSFEGGGAPDGPDQLRLATSGIAAANLLVKGRASHAGASPERGVNALYELSHQLLNARDLSDRAVGRQVHWTLARAGIVRNMIPPAAEASADIRVERVADFDGIEAALRERIKNKLLPESEVSLSFERRRPPLQATDAARRLAAHAESLAKAQGTPLVVRDVPTGGGTDAAFAALNTQAPVIEGMGLRGFGAHTTNAEYVQLDSFVSKMSLTLRLIADIASGRARW
ncbi:glutamate carboxypeptidase [Kinneretia asaccharophila]|uniref:Glutamate carboxypeptidase n=1 Tax=Roseateles asaccharophilus TaxID=582607 RepID=A0A4R6NAJ2_9BURK|nr:glutamate carboxypeptidase [Roseateles asaccharophilus]MDN3544835.1 glutamate carboxypeptidase [Roseateles asaccharophilus]TDP12779.1 glutamate carboxypeptidase [Roseateles asaccharophilus]